MMDPEDLYYLLYEAGVESEELDELVHDCKSSEATDINNAGMEEQVEYLCLNMGMKKTMKLIGICEHGYYQGGGCSICEEAAYKDWKYHMLKDEGLL